ncbi:erythronate-4-phosphate dehydrogenase [Planctomycetales bacterium]|nr:erythronate-4-phosphate dehydrogenase [Planctomycetales bacterium]
MKIVADENQPQIREAFADAGELTLLPPAAITGAVLRDADALICRSTVAINEALLAATSVKFVGTCTIGFDHVDLNYLHARGIGFAAAAGCNANSVGEYVAAALLRWATDRGGALSGKTLGIVGAGNVGKNVARKARALGMNILLNDPPRAQIEGDAEFVELPTLLAASDFVSLHVPLTRGGEFSTVKLADEKFFAAMKDGSVFVNTARGKVVDEDALSRGLGRRRPAAAILDVYAGEPRPRPDFLRRLYLATPHIAGYSYDGKVNGTVIIRQKFAEFFGGKNAWRPGPPPPNFCVSRIGIESKAPLLVELQDVVGAVYDLSADSRAFLAAPTKFAELRANYPLRLEFSHTRVAAPPDAPELTAALAGLGFAVE